MRRPPRRVPSLSKIEKHWGLDHGYCARCGQPARCEKAHVIDRCFDGLDGTQNLVPLCYPCHDEMPSFSPGDEPVALSWVFTPRPAEVPQGTPTAEYPSSYYWDRLTKIYVQLARLCLATDSTSVEAWVDHWRGSRYEDVAEAS